MFSFLDVIFLGCFHSLMLSSLEGFVLRRLLSRTLLFLDVFFLKFFDLRHFVSWMFSILDDLVLSLDL